MNEELVKRLRSLSDSAFLTQYKLDTIDMAIAALTAQQEPQVTQEPVAWMWQHDETGAKGFIENATKKDLRQWERMNKPRRIIAPLYTTSPSGEREGMLRAALKRLSFAAQTSGGTAGRDEELAAAIAQAEKALEG
jgi:hypothetical protein